IGIAADFAIVGNSESDLGPLDFIHRKTAEEEFYFVRNKTRDSQVLTCRFRVAAETKGLVPEFWCPDSGLRNACPDWKNVPGDQTELPVTLGPLGSVFVVFRKPDAAVDSISRDTFVAAETPTPLAIDGPWQVAFPEGWGTPRETSFDKLQSWTESDDEGIRFFSGIATYRKSFDLPESLVKLDRLFLELGDLAEIAEITLNGKRLGLVWLPPYRIEISGAVHVGVNHLEIRVANLWANRLNGDSLRPEATRFTRTNLDGIQTDPTAERSYMTPRGNTRPVYTELPPLMKSGLFGPVKIISPKGI
ncbi:MAG: glycosylhydrolase-like jelly roll fold domain-containing protein, partial [Luteolibacter sp.]